jgi:CBS domain-containing protein
MKTEGMSAADVMTREVLCLREDTTIADAARLLIERRISGAPVVDRDGKLAGVLSEEDLIAVYYEGHRDFARSPIGACRVLGSSLVTRKVVTVKPETDLHEISKKFLGLKIKRVPVVDAAGKVVGVVSRKDILKALVAKEAAAVATKSGRLARPAAPEKK